MNSPELGGMTLLGADRNIWSEDSKHLDELVAVNGNNERVDTFTTWLLRTMVRSEALFNKSLCSSRVLKFIRLDFSID